MNKNLRFTRRAAWVLLSLILFFYKTEAQTLAQGDIVVIGWDSTTDLVRFGVLADIPAGTVIKITDFGWVNSTGLFTNSGTADGIITWTVSSAIPRGTVLQLFFGGTGETSTLTNVATGVAIPAGNLTQTGPNSAADPMTAVGDGIFIYQGADSNPFFISGFNNSAGVVDGTGWNTSIAVTARDSELPNGVLGSQNSLTAGVNAVGMPGGGSQQDVVHYNSVITGADAETWLTRLMTSGQWTGSISSFSPVIVNSITITGPSVTTAAASSIGGTTATLNGTANDNGDASTISFEYGTNATLATGTTTTGATTGGSIPAGTGTTAASLALTGLSGGTTYYYRIRGSNVKGSAKGRIMSFTTTAVSSNANLSALTLSSGTLTPAFAAGTINYTATVGSSVSSINITPTVADATATVTVNGFEASSGSFSTVNLNGAGTNTAITVVVTAQNGTTKTYTVTITRAAALSASVSSQTNVACNGASTGAATISATGGTSPYTYSWAPAGGTAATATGLTAGAYTVTVTDNSLAQTTVNVTIIQPAAITSSVSSQTNVSCNGGATGSATILAGGGTGTKTYSWAPSGGTAATATGLSAGVYTVTITDANLCTKNQIVTITQPPAISSSVSSQTNVACNGQSTGAATVSASGGTGAGTYTYSWAPSGGTAATATGLSAGAYTVTITDANLCPKTQVVTITQPPAITSSVSSQTNIACNGASNGSATILAGGGTGAGTYTYSWAPSGGTAATATGLSAGSYTVTITDANACTKTQVVTITQSPAITSSVSSQTNVSCNGGSNGSATILAGGGTGTGTYTYSWAPSGGTGATATGLSAGSYTVTITDANACTKTQLVNITQPPAITSIVSSQTNIACNGGATGSATVSATGGTGTYTYSWAPSGGTAATATGLSAGSYTVTITDANLCTKTQLVNITQPAAITSIISSQTNLACNGANTGSATISVSGGTGTKTYSWAPSGGTAATATGLSAGAYTVTITDANGCTKNQNVIISQPAGITSSVSSQTNVSCNGGTNGSATISASGGAGAYTYSWAPSGGVAATATGLAAGIYTVTITDANACTKTQNVIISQPAAITSSVSSQTNVSCNGGTNGSATVSASGGSGAFTYSWAPSGGTAATATGLSAGAYTVTITDANGCTKAQNVTITQPAALVAGNSQINITCNGTATGAASVTPSGGTTPYTYSWSSGQTTSSITGLIAGSYSVLVTDANGCPLTRNFIISQPSALTVTIPAKTDVTVAGGNNGSAAASPVGGTAPYSYNWTPGNPTGDGSSTVSGLSPQTYTLTVTDANGCSATASVTIIDVSDVTPPPAPVIVSPVTTASTNDVTPDISGTAEPSSVVTIMIGGTPVGTANVNTSGNWTFTVPGPLTESSHAITATAKDAAGNVSPVSSTVNLTVDTTSPVVTGVADAGVYNANVNPVFNEGTATLNGAAFASGSTVSTDGDYTLVTTDNAGNVTTVNFKIDKTAPVVASVAVPANGTYVTGQDLVFTVNLSENVVVNTTGGVPYIQLTIGGTTVNAAYRGGSGTTALQFGYTLVAGNLDADGITAGSSISLNGATLADAAGNSSVTTLNNVGSTASVMVDAVAPTLTNVSLTSGGSDPAFAKPGDVVTLNFTPSEPLGSGVTVLIAGQPAVVTQSGGGYQATYTMPLSASEGPVAFSISYADVSGNPGAAVSSTTDGSSIIFDRTVPSAPAGLNAAAQDGQVLVTWTANPESDIAYYRVYAGTSPNPAGPVQTITAPALSFLHTGLTNGTTYYYRITSLDKAGNESPFTAGVMATPKTAQTITFNVIAAQTYSNEDFDPLAVASSGLPVSYSSDNTAVATVVAGKIHITGVGTATITASQPGNEVFGAAAPVTQLLTVNRQNVTVSVNAAPLITKVYDGNTAASLAAANYTLSGLRTGESLTVGGTAVYDTKAAGSGKTVTVTDFVLSGEGASNYTVSSASASTTGTITAKPLSLSLNAAPLITKVYDGNNAAALVPANYNLSGEISGDAVTVSGTAAYNNSNVGTGKMITLSSFVLAGADKDNYTLGTASLATTGNITRQSLVIRADDKVKIQSLPNPALTASYTGFVNGETNAVLTQQPVLSTTAVLNSPQGTYPITVSGAAAANYSISYVNGTLTVAAGFPTSLSLAAVMLYENQPAGTLAGTLSSTSDDPGAVFTYSLVSGTGDTDNNAFEIQAGSNELRTRAVLNYESKSSYSVRVRTTTQYGQSLDREFVLNLSDVNEAPALAAIADQAICYTETQQTLALSGISPGEDANQTVSLSVSNTNSLLFNTVTVSSPSNGSAQLQYTIRNGQSGTGVITVTVTDDGGTANGGTDTFSRSFTVTVNPLPAIVISSDQGASVSKGATVRLSATGGTSYQWASTDGIISGQNSATLEVRPSETTTYSVTANNGTCSTVAEFRLEVLEDYDLVEGTNLVTPNGDGVNDKFVISNIDMYPNHILRIYDRAGRELYKVGNYSNDWDATLNGAPLAEDSYYYIIDFEDGRKKIKGYITVIRD